MTVTVLEHFNCSSMDEKEERSLVHEATPRSVSPGRWKPVPSAGGSIVTRSFFELLERD
jgi:hypothetical protein